ncbi:chemotaxis response regulator protein-glutamate methylesterase [Herbivorax sp. ANBcel31]|uniref:protein-glutamate methylesterase/protein-glutamine glutaminase n=1 Tax=Herbivorax sp. ANBcel31 TaxID=3069754 RepID=UPI0027B8646A|nr:chemotaxis response regulator protein-glutamate methylesterase [Herbivorax sp. ANBcel31]MDQ2086628.1 chemotaxis response regulator protein-glutamate methylesterase [Herbivorax sp. ANBcel31]
MKTIKPSLRRKIKVLIVDDSLVFRERLARGLAQDASIEVVGTAPNPYAARDKIIEFHPDVMTLDVQMPRMNGIEFLKRLMPQYPIPVVVVSSVSENVFDALNAGAVDFVTKPDLQRQLGIDSVINELIIKIKIASAAKVGHWKKNISLDTTIRGTKRNSENKIIAIGASTGGTEAIASIISTFTKSMPGTVIVQHMPAVFTKMYADRLNNSYFVDVKEAEDGDHIYPGRVLIAPGEHQMKLKKSGGIYLVECFKGSKVNGHCPSVDVLFSSVAQIAARSAVGVILTGMGSDGSKGLLEMRKNGARTIGQDEKSCVVYGMPKVAYNIGAVEKQETLEKIPQAIQRFLEK